MEFEEIKIGIRVKSLTQNYTGKIIKVKNKKYCVISPEDLYLKKLYKHGISTEIKNLVKI